MKTPFDMTLPIETLYDQIENAVELANVGLTPYSAPQVVAVAYLLVFRPASWMKHVVIGKEL